MSTPFFIFLFLSFQLLRVFQKSVFSLVLYIIVCLLFLKSTVLIFSLLSKNSNAVKRIVFLFPILRLLLRKIHLLCQRRLFLPRDFGVSRELSGFNGSFFRREQAPALLLTVNSALLIIGFRATTPGLFRATTQGRPYFITSNRPVPCRNFWAFGVMNFGRPHRVAPTLYSVIAKPIRNSRFRIANSEFFSER